MGSRPLPSKASTTPLVTRERLPRAESAFGLGSQDSVSATVQSRVDDLPRSASAVSFHEQATLSAPPDSSIRSRTTAGRPLAVDPARTLYSIRGRKVSPTAVIEPPTRSLSGNYRESGARWIERQEAVSLREALAEMDQQNEEKRVHAAAQDEAADLVWRHRNPNAAELEKSAAYANPDIRREEKHRFTAHLQKGAYSRSHPSVRAEAQGHLPTSSSFASSSSSSKHSIPVNSMDDQDAPKQDDNEAIATVIGDFPAKSSQRKGSGQRKVSSGSTKGSGFPQAGDQIYQDSGSVSSQSGDSTAPASTTLGPLRSVNRNSQLRGSRPLPGRPAGDGEEKSKTLDRVEIHKNPPSRLHSAGYTRNTTPSSIDAIPEVGTPPSKNGVEIRGEDIRAATSMRLKDRSPKLPLPTAVSDRPGRPIVSFNLDWKPDKARREDMSDADPRPGPSPSPSPNANVPAMTVSAPVVPTTKVSSPVETSVPTINVPDDDFTPAIIISTEEIPSGTVTATVSTGRPLPQPAKTVPGRLPTTKISSRLPWLNPSSRGGLPTATCANCTLPISGRLVTASGGPSSSSSPRARFHPECFTCHHCSTALECVAFYPEPEDRRLKRFEADGLSDNETGSELRFYCHLDFHEFFSPRCRSCKTPIEGEVIVAAGSEWHVGHFFCSECGDPFDSNTPFVEKDNYAYCVSCHTRRTSARCRACKKQILDEMTVQALGGQWHADCFNCCECAGSFGDDGRFFIREVTVEGTEKEKRRGINTKAEERAVCEACEECRLKA